MDEYVLNIFDESVKADPYPSYDALRTLTDGVRNPLLLGTVMVHGHAAATAVLRDAEHFSSAPSIARAAQFDPFQAPTMLTSDPPDHTRLRALVSRAFTPRAVTGLEERLRACTAELIAPIRDGEAVDVVSKLACTLPVIAIAELLGVPASDQDDFRRWSDDLVSGTLGLTDPDQLARATDAAAHLRSYLGEQIDARRARPSDDLIGRLVEANAGEHLDDAELLASCVLLLVAGNETTSNLIANLILALGRAPAERRKLVADAGLVGDAVEEGIRYDAPVQATVRTVLEPVELGGETLDPGQSLLVLLGAANRDPSKFAHPDVFELGRNDAATHLGFGHGIHFCLGASLARLEARVAVTELGAAAPDWDLADGPEPTYAGSFVFRRPCEVLVHR